MEEFGQRILGWSKIKRNSLWYNAACNPASRAIILCDFAGRDIRFEASNLVYIKTINQYRTPESLRDTDST